MADMTREEMTRMDLGLMSLRKTIEALETHLESPEITSAIKFLKKLEAYENADLIERSEAIELVNNPPLVVPFSQVKELENIPRFEPTKGSDE